MHSKIPKHVGIVKNVPLSIFIVWKFLENKFWNTENDVDVSIIYNLLVFFIKTASDFLFLPFIFWRYKIIISEWLIFILYDAITDIPPPPSSLSSNVRVTNHYWSGTRAATRWCDHVHNDTRHYMQLTLTVITSLSYGDGII